MAELGESRSRVHLGAGGLFPQEEMLEVGRKNSELIIGIPSEDLKSEKRVPLTPQSVEVLVHNGHQVIFESGAGKGADYFDAFYSEAGASIAMSKEEVYKADIIIKISPPTEKEIEHLRPGQTILTQLHINRQNEELIRKLMQKRIHAIAFEFLKSKNKRTFPVVSSMNEIEGNAAVMIAGEYLSNARYGGKGVLLGGITGVTPTEIVIIGANAAGEYATRAALGLGAEVRLFDHSVENLRAVENNIGQRIYTSVLHPHVLKRSLKSADALICCLRSFESGKTFIIPEEMIERMKEGSIIVDLAMDQGGCAETSTCTSHDDPVFKKHGVIHYCVPNVASRVAKTASIALSNIFTPLLIELGDRGGVKHMIRENAGFCNGFYIYNGILTSEYVGQKFDIPYKNIDLLMAAI